MKRNKRLLLVGLGIALILAFFFSPLASSLPDGLERVIGKLVPAGRVEEGDSPATAPLPDYTVPGLGNDRLSTGIAGIIGTLAVFGVAFLIARVLSRRKPSSPSGREGG
jgi:hypothetical protein